MVINIPDLIGLTGVLLVLTAYGLLNLNKVTPAQMIYQLMNLVGSVLLLISLCFNFNLASVAIEITWIIISLIGLYRVFQVRWSAKQSATQAEFKPSFAGTSN